MKYTAVINKRVRNMRVCVVLRRPEGGENFMAKLLARAFAGRKRAQPSTGAQKVGQ